MTIQGEFKARVTRQINILSVFYCKCLSLVSGFMVPLLEFSQGEYDTIVTMTSDTQVIKSIAMLPGTTNSCGCVAVASKIHERFTERWERHVAQKQKGCDQVTTAPTLTGRSAPEYICSSCIFVMGK